MSDETSNNAMRDHNLCEQPLHQTREWAGPANDALNRVQEKLETLSASDRRVGKCPALASGKLLRAGLVILAGYCYAGREDDLVSVGTAVELMHAASLLHDDLLDGAAYRRGLPSAALVRGGRSAMLLGDYLFARAFQTLSSLANLRLMQGFSAVVIRMCEAELEQMNDEGELAITEERYCQRIAGKTAHFMAECCRAGSRLSGAPERGVEALGEYGYQLGMAYQLLDDVADYRGTPDHMGKPVGCDVRGGLATMPLILARQQTTDYPWEHWWEHRDDSEAVDEMVEAVCQFGVPPTLERVRRYTATAVASLTSIWPQPARTRLEALPSHLRAKHQ